MDQNKIKEQALQSAILLYFNETLLAQHVITEEEYRQMVCLIHNQYPAP